MLLVVGIKLYLFAAAGSVLELQHKGSDFRYPYLGLIKG